jgi:hypothetical protein
MDSILSITWIISLVSYSITKIKKHIETYDKLPLEYMIITVIYLCMMVINTFDELPG